MEKTHKSGEGVKTSARLAEEAEAKRERIDRLESESKKKKKKLNLYFNLKITILKFSKIKT